MSVASQPAQRLAEPAAEHDQEQEAGQREGRDQPDQIGRVTP